MKFVIDLLSGDALCYRKAKEFECMPSSLLRHEFTVQHNLCTQVRVMSRMKENNDSNRHLRK